MDRNAESQWGAKSENREVVENRKEGNDAENSVRTVS